MSFFDLSSPSGLRLRLHPHGALQRIDGPDALLVNLLPGSLVEGGPAQLWLRLHGERGEPQLLPLLGTGTPLRFALRDGVLHGDGHGDGVWQGLRLRLQLRLATEQPAWFWHLQVDNLGAAAQRLDWVAVQDVGLCAYEAARLNEHYVSQYIDLCPLDHPRHGLLLAARQNQKVGGRHPWLLMGSLRRAEGLATDGLQLHGLALRDGSPPVGLLRGLGGQRLQHEHALMALQDAALSLAPGASGQLGMGWLFVADHPAASQAADVARWDALLAASAAAKPLAAVDVVAPAPDAEPSLFASAPAWVGERLTEAELALLFGAERSAEERDAGQLLSFFTATGEHVVLADKERRVLRPHGHLLRSGAQRVPEEAALTSTVGMGGLFHSMLTQGHVSFNRLLSTQRSYLGWQRSSGLRLFLDAGDGWRQLGLPSAFEMGERHARWIYRLGELLIEVRAEADAEDPRRMGLSLRRLRGSASLRLRASLHLALAGDDGEPPGAARWQPEPGGLRLLPPEDSAMAARFPDGRGFLLRAEAQWRDDGALFADGRSRGLPFVIAEAPLAACWQLDIVGELLDGPSPLPAALRGEIALPQLRADASAALAQILPWYRHNALVHYLAPRGLEQFNGGGWGTRDVCQGPLEMLLALGHTAPVRDLLCRVFAAQNPDGDWPQWFMFFDRDAAVRAGDSHGDIVFWPLLGLARYLLASGDAGLLDETLPFHGEAQAQPLRQHVERALALIRRRVVPGTRLAAYWHGDWNDSLQPADPALRERLCSAWTVTLHRQTLATLAEAWERLGLNELDGAPAWREEAAAVDADFQRLLMRDGVVAGYARFDADGAAPTLLLHPSDRETGLHYSLLPMMHGVINELFTPAQAQQHLALMQGPLQGVDGARLFDAPLAYRGGPETLFQRAESAAFFGREIGVMYTHAHLRYAECLAHLGQAQAFFDALQLAHPVGLRERLTVADLRQANCYYSSSDAAFPDRYTASRDYAQALQGRCRLDGGWRVYSSGPGLAIAILVRHLLGWQLQARWLDLDPVLPPALDGLLVDWELDGAPLRLVYRVGPQGHGLRRLRLDGRELPFERLPNRYRIGAARLSRSLLLGGRELELSLG